MTEVLSVEEDLLLLATIVGAAISGVVTEIRLKSPVPNPEIEVLFKKGVGRLANSQALAGADPAKRDALVAAFRKGAGI